MASFSNAEKDVNAHAGASTADVDCNGDGADAASDACVVYGNVDSSVIAAFMLMLMGVLMVLVLMVVL